VNVVETIQAVRSAGGSVSVSGGSVIVDAPPTMPAAVWEALSTHKATLLDLLAPSVTYAELAAHEEREAIQAEAQAPADAVAFDRPRAARRCRLLRDTPWGSPDLGRVTFPAGLVGAIVDDLNEIDAPVDRLALSWLLAADRAAGKATLPVLIDGRPRVLEAASVEVLPEEGDSQ
jgi:hypothetical protein